MANELLAKIGEVADSIKAMKGDFNTRIGELEQRAARGDRGGGSVSAAPSLGELVVNSDAFKELSGTFHGKTTLRFPNAELATISSGTGTVGATTSAGTSLVPSARLPELSLLCSRIFSFATLFRPARPSATWSRPPWKPATQMRLVR